MSVVKPEPLVSIITPNYNGQKFIRNTIESVIKQTFQNWEMIIVDDGSTDDSLQIIEEYAKQDPRIKFLKTNLAKFPKLIAGPGAARNTAIDAAKGKYIAFLDNDDLWHPTKLEKQISFLEKNSYSLVYTWYDIIDEDGTKIGEHTPSDLKLSYSDLLKDCKIGCLTVMYDVAKLGKQFINLNKYDRYADYSLWLKITKEGNEAYCMHEKLSSYRLVKGSISANKLNAMIHQWHILRQVEKLKIYFAFYNFFFYLTTGFTKKLRYNLRRWFK